MLPGSGLAVSGSLSVGCQTGPATGQPKRRGKYHRRDQGECGHSVDRWVPVLSVTIETLHRAAELQGDKRNLIPENLSYSQWRDHAWHVWSKVSENAGLKGFHDLRAAYACERFEQLTVYPAPVVSGNRQADKETDTAARLTIANELGHGRIDVVAGGRMPGATGTQGAHTEQWAKIRSQINSSSPIKLIASVCYTSGNMQ
ncbi:MAG: integrase domain-containing protein [Gammaproteobacteria bacterium]|nr:integrase domain-containing protein [Gammaproteobacteria bacterium]